MEHPAIDIPFLGDGLTDTVLKVKYAHADQGGCSLVGEDGLTCAYCHGDPCAERDEPDALINRFFAQNSSWAETCPVCQGRPS